MSITLLSASELSKDFVRGLPARLQEMLSEGKVTSRQIIALTAIRTCYSHNKPSEVATLEYEKYFTDVASDGLGGSEADRLFRHIIRSKHTSTLEGITYTFAVENVSRSLLAQLTRHRIGFSFSVQSQRYVKFGSGDKSGGFDYVIPPSMNTEKDVAYTDASGVDGFAGAPYIYADAMTYLQYAYDALRSAGVPAEDARYVLPNATACNIVMTTNLRALIEFYTKRKRGSGAQWEIADFAEKLREEVTKVDAWVAPFFSTEEAAG